MILKEVARQNIMLDIIASRVLNLEAVLQAYVKMQKNTARFQKYLEKERANIEKDKASGKEAPDEGGEKVNPVEGGQAETEA